MVSRSQDGGGSGGGGGVHADFCAFVLRARAAGRGPVRICAGNESELQVSTHRYRKARQCVFTEHDDAAILKVVGEHKVVAARVGHVAVPARRGSVELRRVHRRTDAAEQ